MTCTQETENRELTLVCISSSPWEAPKELTKMSLLLLGPKTEWEELQDGEDTEVFPGLSP